MANRFPALARKRAPSRTWWRPGLPVHTPPEPEDTTLVDVVCGEQLSWEDEAMQWSPGDPKLE